jgi:preprotein translocase subunit SecY
MMPSMIGQAITNTNIQAIFNLMFDPYGFVYNVIFAAMIIFFAFFYTAITFNPVEMADNMKKYGGVIVGVRPGKATADYLNRVMIRITLVGSVFLAGVAMMPAVVYVFLKIPDPNLVQFFGGTSLLILVGVALDTVKQIEQHLTMRHYDGFTAPSGPGTGGGSRRGGRIMSRKGY